MPFRHQSFDAQFFTPKYMHSTVYKFSLDPIEIRWLQVKPPNSIATQIHAFAKNSFAEAENTNTKLARCYITRLALPAEK